MPSPLETQSLRREVSKAWCEHEGTACVGVNWYLVPMSELLEICDAAGAPFVGAILGILARDYGSWSSGFPDLCLHRTASAVESSGQRRSTFKIVEVKGPGDQLSLQQEAWLGNARRHEYQ